MNGRRDRLRKDEGKEVAQISIAAMQKTKVFLFDVDGTLVDTGGAGLRAMRKAFEQVMGIKDPFRGDSFTGRTDPHIFRTAVQRHLGRAPEKWEEERFFDLYLKYLTFEVPASLRYRVLPGIEDLLEALYSRDWCLLGLCTGNLERGARIKLERANLNRFFLFGGFGSDCVDRAELTRVAIERAQALAHGPTECTVIGDSPHEAFAARKNGVRVALVASGWTAAETLRACNPDLFFESFAEPEVALARLLGLGESLRAKESEVERAARIIKEGGVIIHPTSTLYGIAGDALRADVVTRIRRLKGKKSEPFLVIVSSVDLALSLAALVPEKARRLAERFWPGPMTLVLKAADWVPKHLVGPEGTVAVRVDSHPFALEITRAVDVPLISTSANKSGKEPPCSAADVTRDLILACDLFVEGQGPLLGKPSTLVKVTSADAVVLREGAIPASDIET